MKIVELSGIPGSGKSYTLLKLKKKYGRDNQVFLYNDLISQYVLENFKILFFFRIFPVKIKNRICKKIYHLYKYDVKFQNIFKQKYYKLFNFIENYNEKRPIKLKYKTETIRWFLKTGENYTLAENVNQTGFVLIDEGFVQRVSSLFVSELEENVDKKDIIQYLELIPKFNELIFIKRDFAKCLSSRIRNPGFRLKDLTEKKIKKVLTLNKIRLKFAFVFMKNSISSMSFTIITNRY